MNELDVADESAKPLSYFRQYIFLEIDLLRFLFFKHIVNAVYVLYFQVILKK